MKEKYLVSYAKKTEEIEKCNLKFSKYHYSFMQQKMQKKNHF